MSSCRVVVRTEAASGATSALANAWLYWKQGGAITLLRSNTEGLLTVVGAGLDAARPKSYGTAFATDIGGQVELHYSTGDKPTPSARLGENADAFVQRMVQLPPAGQQPVITVPIAPNAPNTVTAVPIAVIVIPRAEVALDTPSELALWPLLWSEPTDAYSTEGLTQGAGIWNAAGNLTVAESQPAPAPGDKVRPRELGLTIEGSIAATTTSAEVSVLAANGDIVPLKTTATATNPLNALALALAAPTGSKRAFKAQIFFAQPAPALGPVQVMIRSTGGVTPRILATYFCPLVGIQVALGADSKDGQSSAPLPAESDEVIVIDFLESPRGSKADISAEARARRMVRYSLGMRDRLIAGTQVSASTPEMPLWMAELAIVGLNAADLEDLLIRKRDRKGSAAPLAIAPSFQIKLEWDGPDITTSPQPYQFQHLLSSPTSVVNVELDASGRLKDKSGDVLEKALQPLPTRLAFPVPNRRLPAVRLEERAWGRRSGATTRPALVVEWQPCYENSNAELIFGGNGVLELSNLSIDGVSVTSVAGSSIAATPTFRVIGKNPTPAELKALADALVERHYNANATIDRISALSLACWKSTIRALVFHEAGNQFDERPSARRRYKADYFGHERDMPIFGAPHGYGFGQLDTPRATHAQVWSFLENLKSCVKRVMEDKGKDAWNALHAHFGSPLSSADRAVFRREIVRRYNGGSEFKWDAVANKFVISPSVAQWEDSTDHSKGPSRRLPYPNNVLGTGIVYSTGSAASAAFPWPVAFPASEYGPDI
jgi:hypothetical protein